MSVIKKIIGLTGILLLNILLLSAGFWYREPVVILGSDNAFLAKPELYDDRANGGNSQAVAGAISEKGLHFEYELKPGFDYPYAGISFGFKGDALIPENCHDLSNADSVTLSLRSARSGSLILQINTWDPVRTKPNEGKSLRILQSVVSLSPDIKTKSLALQDFHIPDWWRAEHQIPADSKEKFLEQVCSIDFVFSGSGEPSLLDTLEVSDLFFSRSSHWARGLAFALSLLVWVVYITLMGKWQRSILQKQRESLLLKPRRSSETGENLPQSEEQILMEYLMREYRNAELSVEKITEDLGFNSHKTAKIIREQTGETFKTLLNRLRTDKASELLKETTMQITQIADYCGYNNVTHFNRVFKTRFNLSPGEFRSGRG